MVSIALPMEVFNEQFAVNRIAVQIASVKSRMSAEGSPAWLGELLRDAVCRGDLDVTLAAIKAAEYGRDYLADSVLRATWFEMRDRREIIPEQLDAFGSRASVRAPVGRGPGRSWWSDWCRNFGLCTLVLPVAAEFGVYPTRNRAARRADHDPSAISLIKKAAERSQIFIEEKTLQDDIWFGLPGTLVRQAVARQMLGFSGDFIR